MSTREKHRGESRIYERVIQINPKVLLTDPPMTGYNRGKPYGGICMKGSVGYDKGVRRYYIAWYDEASKRTIKLWYYRGDKTLPFLKGKQGKQLAETMLSQMRGDRENGVFRLEKYTQRSSDVIPYLRKWLETIKSMLAPGTYQDYKGSIENHLGACRRIPS